MHCKGRSLDHIILLTLIHRNYTISFNFNLEIHFSEIGSINCRLTDLELSPFTQMKLKLITQIFSFFTYRLEPVRFIFSSNQYLRFLDHFYFLSKYGSK